MNRLLIFHFHDTSANEARMAPSAYYMDAEYGKVSVRIYAGTAPLRDAKINIYDDGTSIFSNRTSRAVHATTGADITGADAYEAILAAGQSSEEVAEDFNDTVIDEGSWVYCNLVDSGGGRDFTVQLELHQTSEDETGDD